MVNQLLSCEMAVIAFKFPTAVIGFITQITDTQELMAKTLVRLCGTKKLSKFLKFKNVSLTMNTIFINQKIILILQNSKVAAQ